MNIVNRDVINDKINTTKIIKDLEINKQILISFIFVSIVAYILFNSLDLYDQDYGLYGPASITIWSYGIIIVSLFFFILIDVIKKKDASKIELISPVIVINIIYMFWIFSFNLRFRKSINMRKVPPYYYYYSTCCSIILFVQFIFFILRSINVDNVESLSFVNSEKYQLFNYFLIIINLFLIIIQKTILEKFSVDIL